jgi:UDP-glucose 4-epimerase
MRNVYITGIAGLVGSHLAKRFLSRGYTVTGCDTLIGGYEANVPDGIKWDRCDILDLDSLTASMKGAETILHTAALAYEGLSVFSPKTITENIYSGTTSVATAAIRNGAALMVNCSSMARYGHADPPFTESATPRPTDPYGMAKLNAEQLLNLLSDIHGLKVVHVVPHNIIGVGQRYDDPYRNVVAIMINRLLQGKTAVVYGDGSQKRSFSCIDDCVDPIVHIVENSDIANGEIFNIGPDGNETSVADLVRFVAAECGMVPTVEYFPGRPREVDMAWCSSEKAKKQLGYRPKKTLDEDIHEMVEWIRRVGTKPFRYHLPLEIINDRTPRTWTDKLL